MIVNDTLEMFTELTERRNGPHLPTSPCPSHLTAAMPLREISSVNDPSEPESLSKLPSEGDGYGRDRLAFVKAEIDTEQRGVDSADGSYDDEGEKENVCGNELINENHKLYSIDEEASVVRTFDRRLVLFIALLYMLSFLDRSSM